jgi:transcriptional regulator with XRE-family HTH domain
MREAAALDCPGAVIAAARRAHGLRQDQLGELAGFSQSAISRLEAGSNIAYDLCVLRILQQLLGIPAHLLGLSDRTLPLRADVPGLDRRALAEYLAEPSDDVVSHLLVPRRIVNDTHDWRGFGALLPAGAVGVRPRRGAAPRCAGCTAAQAARRGGGVRGVPRLAARGDR